MAPRKRRPKIKMKDLITNCRAIPSSSEAVPTTRAISRNDGLEEQVEGEGVEQTEEQVVIAGQEEDEQIDGETAMANHNQEADNSFESKGEHFYAPLQASQFVPQELCILLKENTGLLTCESICVGDAKMENSFGTKPNKLPLQYLKDITDNFSDKRELGKGGFGRVYKGVLQNGKMVAVKKLLHSKPTTLKQFENEVHLLMGLQHPNIVQLIGYCFEIQNEHVSHKGKGVFVGEMESLLCLEYLTNGTLHSYLLDGSCRHDWYTRYQIIEGITNGLQYLHGQASGPIIHLDLKPENILLDENMVPKIADFGLSRFFDQRGTICTLEVNGTLGYMPPEYLQGILTPMSDIFSLGVILLVIITGHRDYPDVPSLFEEFIELELTKWRNMLAKEPGCTSLEADCQQIKRCIQIGLLCLDPERAKRPTITHIMQMLKGSESLEYIVGSELGAKIRSRPRKFLDICPTKLNLELKPNEWSPCLVKLTNKTDTHIAFHFKASDGRNYDIEPRDGFILPRCTQNVFVAMKVEPKLQSPQKEKEPNKLDNHNRPHDEILVQSIIVRKERVTSNHVGEDAYNNMPRHMVHNVKLVVEIIRKPWEQYYPFYGYYPSKYVDGFGTAEMEEHHANSCCIL